MLITLPKKDGKKFLLCKSTKQKFEIYCYEENKDAFSVCLLQENRLTMYGVFSFKCMAKQMGYWLSGQLLRKEYVTREEFIHASLENGTHKWQI